VGLLSSGGGGEVRAQLVLDLWAARGGTSELQLRCRWLRRGFANAITFLSVGDEGVRRRRKIL
jgi:hypothetical protein